MQTGSFVKFILRNVRVFCVVNSSENKYPRHYGVLRIVMCVVTSEGGRSLGWGIQQPNHITRSRFCSYSAVFNMKIITPLGLKVPAPLQASHLYTPTPEAENATACVLCVFVKEIFPGSAARIFLLLYHILLFIMWLPIYPPPKTSCW